MWLWPDGRNETGGHRTLMSEPTNSVAVVKTEEAGALLPPAVILAHHCVFVRDSDTQSQLFKLGFGAVSAWCRTLSSWHGLCGALTWLTIIL